MLAETKRIHAGIAAVAVLGGMALGDPASAWTQRLCADQSPQGLASSTIGFQSPAEFEKITYFNRYVPVLKSLGNFWAPPSDIVVYAYPMITLNYTIEDPTGQRPEHALGLEKDGKMNVVSNGEFMEWLANPGKIAIVNALADENYIGTPVEWTPEIEDAFKEFRFFAMATDVASTGDGQNPSERPNLTDIALKLSLASGMYDVKSPSINGDQAVTVEYVKASKGINCIAPNILDKAAYSALKAKWLENNNYLTTANPIPGLEPEGRLLVSRALWPEDTGE